MGHADAGPECGVSQVAFTKAPPNAPPRPGGKEKDYRLGGKEIAIEIGHAGAMRTES